MFPFGIDIWTYVARILVVILLLPAHELAHGYIAYKMGDPTAKNMGRLTLNPIKHIDPLGFLMLLFVGVGFAKPVPVNPNNFKNPKRDYALVAAAGPIMNLLMGFVLMGLSLIVFLFVGSTGNVLYIIQQVLMGMAVTSIALAVFNLLPVPPLDGFNILGGFLPEKVYNTVMGYRNYIVPIFFVLIYFGFFDKVLFAAGDAIAGLFLQFYDFIGLI